MTTVELGPAILFCPADRPDRYGKALERADAIILDLEDAVAPLDREGARRSLLEHPVDPDRTIIRVNAAGTDDFQLDLQALRQTAYKYVMLAKTETADSLALIEEYSVVALLETATGITNAPVVAAAPNVAAIMWGAEDLVASLGGTSSRNADGQYRDIALHARSRVLLAAGAGGKAAWDSVYLDIGDQAGLREESEDAQASGFAAKVSIHPAQMPVIREAFTPKPEEVEHAERVLAVSKLSGGVFRFEGKMVDEPVLRQARRTLARAGKA